MASGPPPISGPDNPIWRAIVDVFHAVWIFVDPDQVDQLANHYRALDALFQQKAGELEQQATVVERETWLDSNGTVFANRLRGSAAGLRAVGQQAGARSGLATQYAERIRAYRREILAELAFLATLAIPIAGIPWLASRMAAGIARTFFTKAHSLLKTLSEGLRFEGVQAGARLTGNQAAKALAGEAVTEPLQELGVDGYSQWFANLQGDQQGYDVRQAAIAGLSGLLATGPASVVNKGTDGLMKRLTPRRRADPDAEPGLLGQSVQAGLGSAAASGPAGIGAEAIVDGDAGILTDAEKWKQAMSAQNLLQAGVVGASYPPTLDAANHIGHSAPGWNPGGGDPPNNNTVNAGPTTAGAPAAGEAGAPAAGEAGASKESTGATGSSEVGATGGRSGSTGGQGGSTDTATTGGNAGSGTTGGSDPSQLAGSSSESDNGTPVSRPPGTGKVGTGAGADVPVRPGSATTNTQQQQHYHQVHQSETPPNGSFGEEPSRTQVSSGEQSSQQMDSKTPSSVRMSGDATSDVDPTDAAAATTDTIGSAAPSGNGAAAVSSQDTSAGTSTLSDGNATETTYAGATGGVVPTHTPAGSGSATLAAPSGSAAPRTTRSKSSDNVADTAHSDEARPREEAAERAEAAAEAERVSEALNPSETGVDHKRSSSEHALEREQSRTDQRSKPGRGRSEQRDAHSRPAPTGPAGSMAPPNNQGGRHTTERGPGQDPAAGVAAETDPDGPVPVGAGPSIAAVAPVSASTEGESAADAAPVQPGGGPRHTVVGELSGRPPVARQADPGDSAKPPEISNGSGSTPVGPSPPPAAESGGPPTNQNPPTPPPTDQGPSDPGPDPNDDGNDGQDSDTEDYAIPVPGYPSWPGDVVPPVGPMESGSVPEGQDALDVLDALTEALEYDVWFIDRVDVVAIRDGVVEAEVRSKDGSAFRLLATAGEVHGQPPARITVDRARRTMHLTISDRLSTANAGIRVSATIAFALGVGEHFAWTEPLGEDALGLSRDPYDVLRLSSRDHGFLALMRYAAMLAEKPPEGSPGRRIPDGIDQHRDHRVAERLLTATLHTLGVLQDQLLADRIIDQIPSEDRPLVRRLAEGRRAGSLVREPEVYLATKFAPTAFMIAPTTVTSLLMGVPVGGALAGLLPLIAHTAMETWQQLRFERSQAEPGRAEEDPEGPPRSRMTELLPGMPRVPEPDESFAPRALRDYYEKFGWTGVAGASALASTLLTGFGNPLQFLLYGAMVSLYPPVVRWFDTRVGERQAERDAKILAQEKNRSDRVENALAERLAHLFVRFQAATGRLQEFGHLPDRDNSDDSTKVDHTVEDHDPGQHLRGIFESLEQWFTMGMNHLSGLVGDWVMQGELQRRDAEVKEFDARESGRRGDQSFLDLFLELEKKMEESVAQVERLAGIPPPSTTGTPDNGLPEVPQPPPPGDRPSPMPEKGRFAVHAATPLLLGSAALVLAASGAMGGSAIINLIGILAAQVLTKPASKWFDKHTGLGKQDEARLGVGAQAWDRALAEENEALDRHYKAVLRYASEQHERDLAAASGSGADRSGQRLEARDLRTGRFGTDQVRAAAREAQVASATAAIGESEQRQAERHQRHRMLRAIERRADELDRKSGRKARRRAERALAAAYNRYAHLGDLGGRPTGLPPLDAVDPARGEQRTDRLDRLLLQVEQARERLARSTVEYPTLLDPRVFLGQLRRLQWVERAVDVKRRAQTEAARTGDRALLDRVTGELDELIAAYDARLVELGIPGGLAEDRDGEDGNPGAAGPPSPDDSDPDNGPSDNGPSTGPGPTGPTPTTQGPDGSSAAKPDSGEDAGTTSAEQTTPAPDAASPDARTSGESPAPQGILIIDIINPDRAEMPAAAPDAGQHAREPALIGFPGGAPSADAPTTGHGTRTAPRTSTMMGNEPKESGWRSDDTYDSGAPVPESSRSGESSGLEVSDGERHHGGSDPPRHGGLGPGDSDPPGSDHGRDNVDLPEARNTAWDTVEGEKPDRDGIHVNNSRKVHILYGDEFGGGGHLHGTGLPGKTEFPESWGSARLVREIEDVARNPDHPPVLQPNDRWQTRGTRGGVQIQVIVQKDGRIWTAHPLGGIGVVKNDEDGDPRPYEY